MNQGKLEAVKQEMARVNINILGISELRWTGMGEFNSEYHYIYYRGQESFRRNGVAIMVNKRVVNAVLGCNLRDQIANIHWIIEKAREFQKNIYFCFIDYAKAFYSVDHNKL